MIERFRELVKLSPIATEKFINHCIGVYEFLRKEGHGNDVCNAGLYHSIYGTSYFDVTVQNIHDHRDLIKKEIGEYAENLVYNMCILPDREKNILNGHCNFEINVYSDISKICRANLIELYNSEGRNENLEFNIFRYDILISYFERNINPFFIKNKIQNEVKVIDNLFPYSYHTNLSTYPRNSLFKHGHYSSRGKKYSEKTARFVSYLSKNDFNDMGLFPYIKKIADDLEQDIFLKEYYIGYYDEGTFSDAHTDSHHPNTLTILIYPNLYWEDEWAGDLKVYDDSPKALFNQVIDFVPGRVILFDSRIKHKVMPISTIAESSRYSIAIKACFYSGLESLLEEGNFSLGEIVYVPFG